MKKIRAINKHQIADSIVIVLLVLVAAVLFRNINYFEVPETDFFQFLDNAKIYRQLKLPDTIHASPANPILIAIFGNIISIPQSELYIARSFNIVFFCLSMFLLWRIARKYFGYFAFLLLALMLSNPISYYVSLHPVSETLFTLSVLFVLYLRHRDKMKTAYIISGLSILIRYEAVAMFMAMALIDGVFSKDKKTARRLIFIVAIPIVIWIGMVSLQNPHHTIQGNPFIQELMAAANTLPNNMIFDMKPFFQFIHRDKSINSRVAMIFFIYALIGISLFMKKKERQLLIITLFGIGYLIIHWFFPSYPDRYSFPIIWVVYLIGLWPLWYIRREKKRFIMIALPLLSYIVILFATDIIQTNIDILPEYLSWNKYDRYENKLVADWLTETTFMRPTRVLTFEPWIMSYFTMNQNITFGKMGPVGIQDCKTVSCIIIHERIDREKSDVLFVVDNYEFDEQDDFWSSQHGIYIFKTFETAEDFKDFRLLTMLEEHEKWAKIYKYQPETQ